MKIIRTYILKECILPFFLALTVLTCIFLLGNLIQLTHLVINKGVSIATIGKVFLLTIPVLLGYTIPIACLVSVILAFSRLSADNEILAMRVNGIYLKSLLIPLFVVGVVLSLFCLILNSNIVPYAHHEQRKMLKTLGAKNPTALLEPGVFIHAFEKQTLFIHRIDDNRLYNVTIWQPQPDGRPTRTIIAKRGEFTPVPGGSQIILKLMNGTSDEPDLKNPNNFYKLNFDQFFMTLDIAKNNAKIDKKPKSMTLRELREERSKKEMLLVETARLDTEFYRKVTWSFAVLFFILLGFPLAVITNKREKTANVVLAIFCAAVYYLLSLGCEALSIESVVPAALIMWVPNLLAGAVTLFLNVRLCSS
ncbi:MAG: LptF/LptG family permease [Candidatus Omnitrophota bacterium]|nr:LptF/LptG family permease [Candidatus Omnitrophota bacterium]MDZ4243436.1 LptF/LptG family permease [Candidatus Omnitrophota bacterium]